MYAYLLCTIEAHAANEYIFINDTEAVMHSCEVVQSGSQFSYDANLQNQTKISFFSHSRRIDAKDVNKMLSLVFGRIKSDEHASVALEFFENFWHNESVVK